MRPGQRHVVERATWPIRPMRPAVDSLNHTAPSTRGRCRRGHFPVTNPTVRVNHAVPSAATAITDGRGVAHPVEKRCCLPSGLKRATAPLCTRITHSVPSAAAMP